MTADEDVIVGRAPSAREVRLMQMAAALSPVESAKRIEARSSFVLTNIGLLGTLVALSTALGVSHSRGPEVMRVAAVICGFGAAFFSLLANAPRLQSTINLSDLNEVQKYFDSQIRVRGWLIRIAYWLLLVTFVSGAAALLSGT